jgi:hypothetical protein
MFSLSMGAEAQTPTRINVDELEAGGAFATVVEVDPAGLRTLQATYNVHSWALPVAIAAQVEVPQVFDPSVRLTPDMLAELGTGVIVSAVELSNATLVLTWDNGEVGSRLAALDELSTALLDQLPPDFVDWDAATAPDVSSLIGVLSSNALGRVDGAGRTVSLRDLARFHAERASGRPERYSVQFTERAGQNVEVRAAYESSALHCRCAVNCLCDDFYGGYYQFRCDGGDWETFKPATTRRLSCPL